MLYVDCEYETISGTVVGIDILKTIVDLLKTEGFFFTSHILYKKY
jgi:hypothetical protein